MINWLSTNLNCITVIFDELKHQFLKLELSAPTNAYDALHVSRTQQFSVTWDLIVFSNLDHDKNDTSD